MKKYLKPICLFLLAFAPRVYQLGFDVINIDASFWKENTYNFVGLFFQRKFGDMAITHHPGVTLMWLGGMAMKVFRGIYFWTHGTTAPDTHSVYLWTHFAQKLPIALLTSLFVVFVYWSVKKLLDERVAFLTAILLAIEPFFLAHSRVFHLDALLTVFMCSSVLTLLLYLQNQNQRYLIVSGIFGGLALLTKSTALFLIPYVGLTFFLGARSKLRYYDKNTVVANFSSLFLEFLIWCLVLAVTFVAVWPSMWIQPLNTLKLYFSGITTEATAVDPHITNPAHFAVSHHVIFGWETYDPAWYYYPVVLALRLSPLVLVFGVVGIVEVVRELWGKRNSPLLPFILYSLFFILAISLAAKKLDRYILPTLPFFCILAAYGLVETLAKLVKRKVMLFSSDRVKITSLLGGGALFIALLRSVTFVHLHPDYNAYFSPLFGGLKGGIRFDPYIWWWGEGYKKVADYLNTKPNAKTLKVALYDFRSFEPFFEGETLDAGGTTADQAGYFIYSIKDRPGLELEKIIKIGGVDYWGVYRNENL